MYKFKKKKAVDEKIIKKKHILKSMEHACGKKPDENLIKRYDFTKICVEQALTSNKDLAQIMQDVGLE